MSEMAQHNGHAEIRIPYEDTPGRDVTVAQAEDILRWFRQHKISAFADALLYANGIERRPPQPGRRGADAYQGRANG